MTKQAKRLAAWDKRYIWHPFTQQAEWSSREPLIIDSGHGVWLKDVQGRRFIDGVSSLWVNVFGHAHPVLNRAIEQQLRKTAHTTFLGLTHPPAIELAKRLIDLAPAPLSRVFYSDNGSTAVEVALKMAYQYWQLQSGKRQAASKKTKFVSMKGGYHGDTLGSVSVGGVDLFHQRFHHLLFSGYQVNPGNFADIEQLLATCHLELAAVVMEPLVQGASGMLMMPKGYLAHVAGLCKKYNVLLIVDEVATGFGRTGTMFAVEQENVHPDFLCVAKSMTGGTLPLAATLTTEKIYKAFLGRYDAFKAFFHGHTYTANPLACAAAIATLDLYKKEKVLSHVRQRTVELMRELAPLRFHPHVKEVRQMGMMVGIELVRDKKRGIPYAPGERRGLRVCDACLPEGVWLRPLGDVVVLMPPLMISQHDLAFMMRVVRRAIDRVTQQKL